MDNILKEELYLKSFILYETAIKSKAYNNNKKNI